MAIYLPIVTQFNDKGLKQASLANPSAVCGVVERSSLSKALLTLHAP